MALFGRWGRGKSGERRLFADGEYFHPNGKAKFLFEDPQPLTEKPTHRYPFILLTGRGTVAQWHTQTRTRQSAVLRKLYPENPFVEINPAADARAWRTSVRVNGPSSNPNAGACGPRRW